MWRRIVVVVKKRLKRDDVDEEDFSTHHLMSDVMWIFVSFLKFNSGKFFAAADWTCLDSDEWKKEREKWRLFQDEKTGWWFQQELCWSDYNQHSRYYLLRMMIFRRLVFLLSWGGLMTVHWILLMILIRMMMLRRMLMLLLSMLVYNFSSIEPYV